MSISDYPPQAFTSKIQRFRRVVDATKYINDLGLATNTLATLPMFGVDASSKSGAKKYIVGGWSPLWDLIQRLTKQNKGHFYEMLQEGVPIRLFFDLDVEAPCSTFEDDMNAVIDAVKTRVKPTENAVPIILDSTTPTKHSRHLVFPHLVMPNMESVKKFVHTILADLHLKHPSRVSEGNHIMGIDPAVYTKGRLFRVLGSSKRNKTPKTPFRLLSKDEELTPEVFFKTLVTPFRTQTYENPVLDAIPKIEGLWEPFESESSSKSEDGITRSVKRAKMRHSPVPMPETVVYSDKEWDALLNRCQRWLQRCHPTIKTFYPARQGDTLEFVLSPGVPCPNNGDVAHRSNKTWFKVNLRNYWGRYTCCDPACSHHSWGKRQYRDMIVNSFLKK